MTLRWRAVAEHRYSVWKPSRSPEAVAAKWRAVKAEIDHEQKVLARCRAQEACPAVAQELLDIVAAGAGRSGRARVDLINRTVDLAIMPTRDQARWGWRTNGVLPSRRCKAIAAIARTTRS
jgi:hypothetical protein